MTGEGAPNAGAPNPTTPTEKRSLSGIAAGGGDYLKAADLPARGQEFEVITVGWEPNFAKDAEIPTFELSDGSGEDTVKLKITTKANAKALVDAGVADDLANAVGLKLYLQRVKVSMRDGTSKDSIQIAEVNRPTPA